MHLLKILCLTSISSTACAQITLNTPSGTNAAIQCAIYQVNWTGGNGPYELRLNDASDNLVEELGNNIQGSPFPWTVNEPSGQEFAMVILDSQGNTGSSGLFTIQPSSDSTCFNGGAQ